MEKIDYTGIVWAINHNNPEPLVEHSLKKLQDYGIKKEDIVLTDAPENVKVGAIVVEIWPYHLEIGRVRTIRNESFISGSVMIIELKTDADGKYIDEENSVKIWLYTLTLLMYNPSMEYRMKKLLSSATSQSDVDNEYLL